MRVNIIANRYPTASQTFVRDHVTAVARSGNDVAIFCRRAGDEPTTASNSSPEVHVFRRLSSPISSFTALGESLRRVLAPGRKGAATQLAALGARARFGMLHMLGDLAERGTVDIVHAHFGGNAELAALARATGITRASVVTVHGMDLRVSEAKGRKMWRRHAHVDAVLAHSHWAARTVQSFGVPAEKTIVRRPGVRTSYFRPLRTTASRSGGLSLVTVARLEPVKSLDVALGAVAKARSRGVAIDSYDIIGGGTLQPDLERLATRLGLSSIVRFHGTRDSEYIRDRLQHADVFLLSSRAEGLPLSMLEAAACALPVVGPDVGGLSEGLVPGESGFLVESGSEEAIVAALTQLEDRAMRSTMGARGRDLVLREFSSDTLDSDWSRFYGSLLERRDLT